MTHYPNRMNSKPYWNARHYCKRRRNPHKRKYALAYMRHLTDGWPAPPRPRQLGVMGAQAVEMDLRDLLAGKEV